MSAAAFNTADTASYTSSIEFLLPRVLDVGARYDEFHYGHPKSRLTLSHRRDGEYTADWAAGAWAERGGRDVIYRARTPGLAIRGLLAELERRVAQYEEEAAHESR